MLLLCCGDSRPKTAVRHRRLSAHDAAFDAQPDSDDDAFVPSAYLEDQRFEPAAACEQAELEALRSDRLGAALAGLDERARDIVASRWLTDSKATLHELADRYGVSAERIRQLEKNALGKIRQALPEFEPGAA